MAFSIFNKTGTGNEKPSSPDSGKAVAGKVDAGKTGVNAGREPAGAANTATTGPKTGFPPTAAGPSRPGGSPGIPEMMAYDVEQLPLLQEIAVLCAADRTDAAQALLKKAVQDKTPLPQAWLMLLELYKLRGMKRDFEDLAMTYTVKFERSPPTWNEQGGQPETRKDSRQASDFFNFLGKEDLLAEVKKLSEFASRMGSVRIDVGKIKAIEPLAAGALAQALVDFRKRGLPVRFNNVNLLTGLAKKTIAEHPSKDYVGVWQLLFELYERQGMQSEFEDLGLEYAMSFEMSPPSWEPVPVQSAATETEPAGDAAFSETQGFPLRGTIALDNLVQMQPLFNHAAANKDVHINMAGLQRIDFSAVGIFIDALIKFNAAGKKVVLVDVNELIFPLLEAFGATRIAVLLRRKA